jgi:PAS domain S-box-containing protein
MPAANLTDQAVRSASVPPGKVQLILRDAERTGLLLVVGRRRKTWAIEFVDPAGRKRRASIGFWPDLSLRHARKLAAQEIAAGRAGRDLAAEPRQRRRAARPRLGHELEAKVAQRTAELTDSWRFLEHVAATTPDILYVYDLAQGRNIYVNGRLGEMLGYTAEMVQAMPDLLTALVHPDDLTAVREHHAHLAQVRHGEVVKHTYRMRHADGSWRWLRSRDVMFARAPNGMPRQILGLAQDITKHRRAEAALRENEARLRSLFANMRDIVFYHGTQGERAFGYDERGVVAYGADAHTMAGTVDEQGRDDIGAWYAAIHPEDLPGYLAAEQRRKIRNEPYTLEYRVIHPATGELRWIRETAWVVRHDDQRVDFDGYVLDITEQKQREFALVEAQARLSDFAQASSDWLWETDAEHRFTALSDRFRDVLGIDPATALGRRRWDYRTGDLADSDWEAHRRALEAGEPFRDFVYGLRDASGHRRVLQISGVPVLAADGTFSGHRGVARDITRTIEAEEALRASEARFRSLVTNLQNIVFCHGFKGSGPYGYDEHGAALYGADAPTLTGNIDEQGRARIGMWYAAIHPEDRPAYLAAEQRRKERHEPYAMDYRITHPITGELRWMREVAWVVEDRSGRVSFDGYIIDITEQKRTELALRESEERYRSLVEAAPVGIVAIAEGQCSYGNPAAVQLLGGSTVRDLLGQEVGCLLGPDGWRALQADLVALAGGPGCTPPRELSCPRADGTAAVVEASAVVMTWGEARAAQLVLVDLSERKRAEAAHLLLIDELNHRVRNMLATIEAMIGFTAAGATSAAELGEVLSGRVGAMARTHDLLTTGRWEGASLSALLAEELQPYAVADRIRASGEHLLLMPKAALSLSLVLHELTTNALKHGSLSTPNGWVDVSWSAAWNGAEPAFRLLWAEHGGPEVEPPVRHGFGSELIRRAAAQDLGGSARLQFKPSGLRCELRAPLARVAGGATPAMADPALVAVPARRHAGGEQSLHGLRVLLVEDELLLTMMVEAMLERAGAQVIGPAVTVMEACSLIEAQPLDVAVLDVNLAEELVTPVADLLRARGVPFLFATGYATAATIPARYRDVLCVSKPYRAERLRQALLEVTA